MLLQHGQRATAALKQLRYETSDHLSIRVLFSVAEIDVSDLRLFLGLTGVMSLQQKFDDDRSGELSVMNVPEPGVTYARTVFPAPAELDSC